MGRPRPRECQRPPKSPREPRSKSLGCGAQGCALCFHILTGEGIKLLAPADQRQPGGAWWKGAEVNQRPQKLLGRGAEDAWTLGLCTACSPPLEYETHPETKYLIPCARPPRFSQQNSHLGKGMVSPSAGKDSRKSFQHTMFLTPLPPLALFANLFLDSSGQPPLPHASFSFRARRGMINDSEFARAWPT